MDLKKRKNITVLGSTGSIGVNALNIIRHNPDRYSVHALSAGKNVRLFMQQIREFRPKAVAVLDRESAATLKKNLENSDIKPEILYGVDGFIHVATMDGVDTVISAISGAAGLMPTFEAVKAGKEIALANKETMVMAGSLVTAEAEKQHASIIPVDSEHSAIFQSMQGHLREDIEDVILTASGGPFREMSIEQMHKVTAADALKHPNWNMGQKITIDSATMMNKGLEVIEAKWLFDLDTDQISVLVHSQSIIHSMVRYRDGAVIAQLGVPDMTVPISYALSWPQRLKNDLPPLNLDQIGTLTFEKPDTKRFRCLALALEAIDIGQSMPAVMNGANEIAVDAFLNGKIGFMDIPVLIEKTMEQHKTFAIDNIDAVLAADKWAREKAGELVG